MKRINGKILLIGYGNPGRLDDGLGPAFASKISMMRLNNVTVEIGYQLAVEHAEMISNYDVVIFADASVSGSEPYQFTDVEPTLDASFSTHSVSPSSIMGLAQNIFHAKTEAYLLTIRGYEFDDFGERLSPQATENLHSGIHFLKSALGTTSYEVKS